MNETRFASSMGAGRAQFSPDGPKGSFITFEGPDGVGKSTHIRHLHSYLASKGLEVVRVREPGSTPLGERLRQIVLEDEGADISDKAELFIYEACRAQLMSEVVLPALRRGAVVLCDRFTDSSIAYQGYGRGLDTDFIEAANTFAIDGVYPDATIFMYCADDEEPEERLGSRDRLDRIEHLGGEFQSKVEAGFAELAKSDSKRIFMVDASGKHSETAMKIMEALSGEFDWFDPSDEAFQESISRMDAGERFKEF